MKNILISCLSFYFFFSCTEKKIIDVNKNKNLETYLNQINIHLNNNYLDSASYIVRILSKEAIQSNQNYYQGKAYSINGYINLLNRNNDSAFYFFNQSQIIFKEIKDSLELSKILGNMAIIQIDEGDYLGSEITSVEALKYENKNNSTIFSSIYNSLANSSRAQKNDIEAIYWYKKAIESVTDSLNKKIYINNIAVSNRYLKNYNESILILDKLLKDSIVFQNPDLKSKVIDNLAYSKWKQNPDKAMESEFNEALEIRIENDDKWGQIASHSHLTEYFTDKNSTTALIHAQKMYSIANELKSPDDRLEALQKLITLETPENAKKYAIQYASLNDSLVTARNRAKDQFAKIRYDTEKNREENQSLKIKDVESQLRIQRQRNTNIIAISGVIILVIAVLFVYFQQKNKRKRERLIASYESEVRMSKKVHDVVANDLHKFILRLQTILSSNHPEKEKLIAEIENIYQSSRDISHEFQAFDKKDFNAEIRYLLSSYQSASVKVIFNLLEDETWEMVKDIKKGELFRVLQEIMTNMSKHSKADLVLIEFKKQENKIKIVYRDNGIGFSESTLMKKSGIANTENRMENIKGSIIFDSNPGNGLIITITFPI